MVSADQFLQCDVRMRQAKLRPEDPFGNLALNVCGDFLQLPPVDKDGSRKSLAKPPKAHGDSGAEEDNEDNGEADADRQQRREEPNPEGMQGFQLWRSLKRVVCLTVNVRAPGVLSRLQQEMRAGHISDQMWTLYQSRVLTPNDPRLTAAASPFAEHEWKFIVHRHKIRVATTGVRQGNEQTIPISCIRRASER